MTPSPPKSPESEPSSRPESSGSTSPAAHDTDTPRPSFAEGLPPISLLSFQPHSLPPISHAMGAAGPSQEASRLVVWTASRTPPRLSRRKSNESIRPSSSGSSRQAMEEDEALTPEQSAGPSRSPVADPEPTGPHQKKKRTRTLTTPHQSAVLHALLAQSRFPTTAMREEVGRSIGLSARKVQNQRQKARKPRAQSTASLSRPPQFGPYPSAGVPEGHPAPGVSDSSGTFQGSDPSDVLPPLTYHDHASRSGTVHPRGLPAPHQGIPPYAHHLPEYPGLPTGVPVQQQYPPGGMGPNVESGSSSTSSSGTSGYTPFRYDLPQETPYASQRPYPPHVNQGQQAARSSDPPIVLPPLRFDQPRASQIRMTLPPPPLHRVDPYFPSETHHSIPYQSGISPSSSSHLPSPSELSHPLSRHSEGIPPPFTLQPQPQWSPENPIPMPTPPLPSPAGLPQSSYGSFEHSRHHRRSSDPTRALPPLSMIVDQDPRDQTTIAQPWRRPSLPSPSSPGVGASSHRFDPVHSAIREGDHGSSQQTEGGLRPRRHRHTYDFARPSRSLTTPSPPRAPHDSDAENSNRQSD